MTPARLASLLAEFIVDDLKLRRKDWSLVADLIGQQLRNASHNHEVRHMLAGNLAVIERRKKQ